MKTKPSIFATLSVATFLAVAGVGCNQTTPSDENQPVASTNVAVAERLQNAKEMATNAWLKTKEGATNAYESMKESVQSAGDSTFDKKDAFVAKASSDLDALDQNIKELGDKAAAGTDSVKADAQVKLQELRDKRTALQQKLEDARNATAENWNEAKAGFQQSYDDMKSSVKAAWQWLNDKLGTSSP